jgi:NAD(P)-dependent dehydrogenase (short-subunit alcohol dehydrogenase family)
VLDHKIAVVTGAGRGIGEAIAIAFASKGASVALVDRDFPLVQELSKKLQSNGHDALAVGADVSIAEEVSQLARVVLNRFDHVDILVNNAGLTMFVPTSEMTENEWDRIIAVNLKGAFLCSQAVGRHMRNRKSGKMIIIASAGAHRGIPRMAAYCASKAGIISLTRALAGEWAEYNISVNSVSPGMIETSLVQKLREQSPETFAQRLKVIPLRRGGQVQDVVNLVLFLASPDSDYITGQDIIIDGGLLSIHPGYLRG